MEELYFLKETLGAVDREFVNKYIILYRGLLFN